MKSNNITIKNEIKEALWISSDYEEYGILCNPTLKNEIIPDLIDSGYMEAKNRTFKKSLSTKVNPKA